MYLSRSAFPCLLTLALVACGTDLDESVTAPPVSLNQGNGVVLIVQGVGVVNLAPAGVGNASFQLVAIRRADGSVSGHFSQTRDTPSGLVDFSGIVTCVTIDPAFPGRARVGGRVTENNSTHPGFLTINHEVGDDVWFRVTDSELGLDAADASTTYGFKPTLVDTSEQYCALPFTGSPAWNPASIFPLEQGFIQVLVK